MYPDVAFSVLTNAFSEALYRNSNVVNVSDVYMAIRNSKRIYPDSIVKELDKFRIEFQDLCAEEHIVLPPVTKEELV